MCGAAIQDFHPAITHKKPQSWYKVDCSCGFSCWISGCKGLSWGMQADRMKVKQFPVGASLSKVGLRHPMLGPAKAKVCDDLQDVWYHIADVRYGHRDPASSAYA
eukprot:3306532-Rhodomonas_salina.1